MIFFRDYRDLTKYGILMDTTNWNHTA